MSVSRADIKKYAGQLNDALRSTQALSQLVQALPNQNVQLAGKALEAVGYGRKKRGKGFGSFLKNVASVPIYAASGTLGGLNAGIQGLGRKPRKPKSKKSKASGAKKTKARKPKSKRGGMKLMVMPVKQGRGLFDFLG